jgi:hypothetical protein
MPKPGRNTRFLPRDDAPFALQQRKPVPHAFVLDAISSLSPRTRSMFGGLAVYAEDKVVFILRDKPSSTADNGVWLATAAEHHPSLRQEFPNMRSIQVLGKAVTGWRVLPADAQDFEESALRACELVLAGDPRIGKVPKSRVSETENRRSGVRTEGPTAKTRASPSRPAQASRKAVKTRAKS